MSPRPAMADAARADRRDEILEAACRLFARAGVHQTSTGAIAKEVGMAAGTLFLYFPSKEALVSALYLKLRRARAEALRADPLGGDTLSADSLRAARVRAEPRPAGGAQEPDAAGLFWRSWSGYARWAIEHTDAWVALQRCEASGLVSDEARAEAEREHLQFFPTYQEVVAQGRLPDVPVAVFLALFEGPVLVLARLSQTGAVEVTDDVLRATFEGVRRAVLPAAGSDWVAGRGADEAPTGD